MGFRVKGLDPQIQKPSTPDSCMYKDLPTSELGITLSLSTSWLPVEVVQFKKSCGVVGRFYSSFHEASPKIASNPNLNPKPYTLNPKNHHTAAIARFSRAHSQ